MHLNSPPIKQANTWGRKGYHVMKISNAVSAPVLHNAHVRWSSQETISGDTGLYQRGCTFRCTEFWASVKAPAFMSVICDVLLSLTMPASSVHISKGWVNLSHSVVCNGPSALYSWYRCHLAAGWRTWSAETQNYTQFAEKARQFLKIMYGIHAHRTSINCPGDSPPPTAFGPFWNWRAYRSWAVVANTLVFVAVVSSVLSAWSPFLHRS